jgi:hypothetical protein
VPVVPPEVPPAPGVAFVPPVVTTLASWTWDALAGAELPVGEDVAEADGVVVGLVAGEVPVDPVGPLDGALELGRMAVLGCAAGEKVLTRATAPPRATTPAATATPALREIRDLIDPVG